jgi:plasmid stabilization system protein ParE
MDFKIIWTDPAIDGLREIVQVAAVDNPPAAERLGLELVERMEITKQFPRSGPLYSQTGLAEIRCLTHGNYRLYYQLGADPEHIEVVAVRHSAREQPRFS